MRGEELGWFRLADRLGISVQRAKRETSSREFVRWMAFMEWDANQADKTSYYLAQLCAIVAGLFSKKPIRAEDYLIKFTFGKNSEKAETKRAVPWQERRKLLHGMISYAWETVSRSKAERPPVKRPSAYSNKKKPAAKVVPSRRPIAHNAKFKGR